MELRVDPTDGAAYSLDDFIEEYGGSSEDPPPEWHMATRATSRSATSRSRSRSKTREDVPCPVEQLWEDRSWEEVKKILCGDYEVHVEEDEDLCIVSARHDSSLWSQREWRKVLEANRGSVYEKSSGRLLCLPFMKFWNHSERQTDEIDWTTAVAEEKIDGNLMKLFFYKDTWRLASNRTLRVCALTGKYACTGRSNYDLFAEAAKNSGLNYDRLDPKCCYMFERVHPEFRVVLDYPKAQLYHLGTRDMQTLQELDVDIGVPKPRRWTVRSRQECQSLLESFHSFAEGLVVRDASYCRQKWKRREYLLLHSARMLVGGDEPCYAWVARCSTAGALELDRLCLNVWLRREASEFAAYFPEAMKRYQEILKILEEPGFLAKVLGTLAPDARARNAQDGRFLHETKLWEAISNSNRRSASNDVKVH
ncbi:unnamed protein product [Durusdinium trenchii]|uniref:T4 RNA ligase 1-like N-terminal domain-containing protein n=1 Tax=Durusdinium trenchii TaxID=1381693 RepID=A0ABP0I5W7_9DINO